MSSSPYDAIAKNIDSLQPYVPGMSVAELARKYGLDPTGIIKLASNENPSGPSSLAIVAASSALTSTNRYPDGQQLVGAIASSLGVNDNMVILGNGSNDILDLVARVFLQPGKSAVMSQYAFAIYELVTQITGADKIVVTAKQYGHDLAAMAQAITSTTSVVWIANPNNPTGTFIDYDSIKTFLQAVPANVIVVLDEAYFEYLEDSEQQDSISWINEFPNLVITRTFSKIYGLAGFRVGYAVANPKVVELLNRVRQPFNVSNIALAAAEAALGDGSFVQTSRNNNISGRAYLVQELSRLGLEYIPSHGNFIAFFSKSANDIHARLLAKGIIVRPLAASGMPDHLRVSVGLPSENERFVRELELILGQT